MIDGDEGGASEPRRSLQLSPPLVERGRGVAFHLTELGNRQIGRLETIKSLLPIAGQLRVRSS